MVEVMIMKVEPRPPLQPTRYLLDDRSRSTGPDCPANRPPLPEEQRQQQAQHSTNVDRSAGAGTRQVSGA
jgi:hypothetical protein